MIKITCIFLLSFIFILFEIDKSDFYKAFESDSKITIEKKISTLEEITESATRNAYLGALKMKIAGHIKQAKDKLESFKLGKTLLEVEIVRAPNNAEFRFLRLVIQENSPKFLKYKSNLNEDAAMVTERYKLLDILVKKVILGYSTSSKYLNATELN